MNHILAAANPIIEGGSSSNLQIGGTPILLPDQINSVSLLSGAFGGNIVKLGVDLFFFFGVLLTFGFIFFGGVKWLMSQGEKKAVEEARNILIFSIIGFVVMCLAFLAISIIGTFFKVPLIGK